MPKKIFRMVYALNYCVQAAFTLICPAGLLILSGWLLQSRCGLGRWVMIVAIVLGVLVGFSSMIRFLLTTSYAIDPTQKKGGDGNDGSGAHTGV